LSLFSVALAAATVSVTSRPETRGSITPGLDGVVTQSITLKTNSGEAQLTGIILNEFGTGDASTTVDAVKIYKETNGMGRLQTTGAPADTLMSTTPGTYSGGDTTQFNFSVAETLSTSSTSYYIVYNIKPAAPTNVTVGSQLVDKNSVLVTAPATVAAFSNLRSRELAIVAIPHGSVRSNNPSPFSSTSNLCETCHAVHLAPDFSNFGLTGDNATRRLLIQPYFESPDVVNDPTKGSDIYNALCLSCHDGTGASTVANIKQQYSDITANRAGHLTNADSTITADMANAGYKAPKAGKKYNTNVKIPCMICHDVHTSTKNNYAMLADQLYDYSTSNGWNDPNANGRIDSGDEACEVCHRYTTETTRTAIVMGYDLTMPQTHEETSTACLACHSSSHALTVP
jgi:hypothetical protein